MQPISKKNDRARQALLRAGACTAILALLTACGSRPVPREQLAVGRASVEAAQGAGAAEYAPVELNRAREKLGQAQAAVRAGDMIAARRLAEQADADAQVARTRAHAERSRRAADEVQASVRALREQVQQQVQQQGQPALMPQAPAAGQLPQGTGQGGSMQSPSPSQPQQ